jgi:hypothetical protein
MPTFEEINEIVIKNLDCLAPEIFLITRDDREARSVPIKLWTI